MSGYVHLFVRFDVVNKTTLRFVIQYDTDGRCVFITVPEYLKCIAKKML